MANIITGIRIVLSIALMFCPTLSPTFYALYVAAGFSDMIDGAVARKTGTASEFGSKLDTIADIVFVAVCLIKLLPVLHVPLWLYIWIAVIAFIKVANIAAGFVGQKELISVHSMMNKVTGGMLFVLPLTLAFIDLRYSAAVVCVAATIAAIQEGYLIKTFQSQQAHASFCPDSPSVRNTKHFICVSLMTSDKEVHGHGSIQNR